MAAEKERGSGSASAEIGKYLEILVKDPRSRVFAPLAEAYRKAGLLDDAIETALEGLRHHPPYLGGRVALGRAYYDKRQYAEAESEMRQVVRAAPDNLMAHKVLGQIAFRQGDSAAAEKAARMVLLLDPRDEEARQLLDRIGGGGRSAPLTAPAPEPPPAASAPAVPERLPIEEISFEPQAPAETTPILPIMELAGEAVQAVAEPPSPVVETVPPSQSEITEPISEPIPEEILEPPPEPEAVRESLELEPLSGFEPQEAAALAEEAHDRLELEPLSGPEVPSVEAASEAQGESTALELEIFSREPAEEPARGAAEPGPGAHPAVEDAGIEVFGRPKRGGPPRTAKGEGGAFAEIDLEPAPAVPEAATADESPFEIFTRDPRGAEAQAGTLRPDHGEGEGFREIDLEPAVSMTSTGEAAAGDSSAAGTGVEPSSTEALREVDLSPRDEMEIPPSPEEPSVPAAAGQEFVEPAPPETAPAAAGYYPVEELIPSEFDRGTPLEEPPTATAVRPTLPPPAEPLSLELEVHDGTEAPDFFEEAVPVETAAPLPEAPTEEMAEEATEESPGGEPAPESARPPERGVFDTETLAAIYVSQGFYPRAAEIYRRLAAQHPGDERLLRALDDVLAREREERRAAAAAASPVEERIRLLQALLDAFKGGRPQ